MATIVGFGVVVGMLFCGATAFCEGEEESQAPLSLSVQDSVRIAVQNHPVMEVARQEEHVARGKLTEARSAVYPNLSLSGSYTWLERVPSANFEGRTFTLGEQGNYLTSAQLSQTLFAGGRTLAGIRAAKYLRTLAEQELLATAQTIAFSAEKAYYDVLLNEEYYVVSRDALELTEGHQSDVRKRFEQGVVSDYDLLRATIEVSSMRAEMLRARNALNLAKNKFLKSLALPFHTEFVLTDTLQYEPTEAKMEESLAVALLQRPELKQADLQIAVQKESIHATAGALYPTLSAIGTWEGGNASRFSFGGTDWDQGWYVGAMLSFPLFEGMKTKGKLVQERAKLRQLDFRKQDLLQTVELEVKQSILSLDDAAEFVESQKENVRQAQEGLRLADVRYANDMATELDVLDARLALTQARNNHAQAVYSHMLARLALKKAMGVIPLP